MASVDDRLASQRMQTLVRLSRAAAHEARGASSSMAIHAELLATTLDEQPDAELGERQRRYLNVMQEERRRLQRLIDAFFDYVSLPDPTVAAFDLAALAADVFGLARLYGEERHVTVELAPAAGEVPCRGARELLRHLLLNLVLDVVDQCAARARVQASVTLERGVAIASISVPDGHHPLPADAVPAWSGALDEAGATLRVRGRTVCVELPAGGGGDA